MNTMSARPAFLSPPSEYYTADVTRGPPSPPSNMNYHYQPQQPAGHTRACLLNPTAPAPMHDSLTAVLHTSQLAAAAAAGTMNAAATSTPIPTVEDMESAIHSAKGLFASGASIEPAYELRGELGRGKYGRVFLVEDTQQHCLFALKATLDPNWLAAVRHSRLQTQVKAGGEARGCAGATEAVNTPPVPCPPHTHVSSEVLCMRECNSPFVVRLHGAEKVERGKDLLLLEYVDCGDLREEMRRRRATGKAFTETEVGFIFVQLCMAVDHLHQRNILHHDVKPENILLSSAGIIKLGDFGFARKYAESVSTCVAQTGCGTPYYLSPEALRGERYSLKSEMWALGVTLYELMALTGPFVAANRNELRSKVHEGRYAPLPNSYSPALREVCARLLSQNPDDRPSVQELFTDNTYLRELLGELRRTSECSTGMSPEERGSMFFSISAALRRRSPTMPCGVAAVSNCNSWSGSLDNSYGISAGSTVTAANSSAATQKMRIEY